MCHLYFLFLLIHCLTMSSSVTWWHAVNTNGLWWHQGSVRRKHYYRCSEPRPLVALHGRRADIFVPHCQSALPPLPKILSICPISGADTMQGMHFFLIHCCALARPASGNKGSCVRVFTATINTWSANHFCFCKQKQLLLTCLDTMPIKVSLLKLLGFQLHKLSLPLP